MVDESSLVLSLLCLLVFFVCSALTFSFNQTLLVNFTMFVLFLACYYMFLTNNLLLLYFFYEASLIPILYIIVKWGSYPERSLSAMMMLSYTLLLGSPFLLVLVSSYYSSFSFSLSLLSVSSVLSPILSLVVFATFAVKLPIYGLHYWLPMAHVEAPTFGSVILASLLLKLGGIGLLRMLPFLSLSTLRESLLGYLLVFTIFSIIVCSFQSDFKRLVAYSSVAHMMVIPFLIVSSNLLSVQSTLAVMILHGLTSSLLFIMVGFLYTVYSSRQLVLSRGLVTISPLTSFLLILIFFFTLSAPPFPSFVAEVFFAMSSFILTSLMYPLILLLVFLSLVYNLNWLSSIVFSGSSVSSQTTILDFNTFLSVFMFLLSGLFSLGMFSLLW